LDVGVTLPEGDLGVKLKRALDMTKPCPNESFTEQQQVPPPVVFPLIFMQGKLVLWAAATKIICGLQRALAFYVT